MNLYKYKKYCKPKTLDKRAKTITLKFQIEELLFTTPFIYFEDFSRFDK